MPNRTWNPDSARRELRDIFIRIREYDSGYVQSACRALIRNAKRDGIRVEICDPKLDGWSYPTRDEYIGASQLSRVGTDKHRRAIKEEIPVRYDIKIRGNIIYDEYKFAVIVHELAHVYCGHLGSRSKDQWPDRWEEVSEKRSETEAECVTYLVCRSLDIDNYSREYLSWRGLKNLPKESLSVVVDAANRIEGMCGTKRRSRK